MKFNQMKKAHEDSMLSILKASVPKFFDVTPSGTVQQRFQNDSLSIGEVLENIF
jgi:hypothetical protein